MKVGDLCILTKTATNFPTPRNTNRIGDMILCIGKEHMDRHFFTGVNVRTQKKKGHI